MAAALSGNKMGYEITRRQSTFWDFTSPERLIRVHFMGKKEFGFVEPAAPDLRFEERHPLLADYSNAWMQIFVSSPAAEPVLLLQRICESVSAITGQWRSFAHYRKNSVALEILALGYGALGGLPITIASVIASLLAAEGVRFTVLPSHGPSGEFQALIAGRNWVVAESFRVEELPLNQPLQPGITNGS